MTPGNAVLDDKASFGRYPLQRSFLHLRLKIIRKLAAELVFDGEARLAVRHAEKADQHLIGCDRIAVSRQDLGVGAAGNDLAVDEHAVAVENNKIDRHSG